VAHYLVDPEPSSVSAVARPVLGEGMVPDIIAVDGEVEITGDRASGSITITFDGHPSIRTELDLDHTRAEVSTDADGAMVLHGRASLPAGVLGLTGPPMLNLTVLLRWRLLLIPS
jgi:hypothetical protein